MTEETLVTLSDHSKAVPVPVWAEYVAMDEGGLWWAFGLKPKKQEPSERTESTDPMDGFWALVGSGAPIYQMLAGWVGASVPWSETLQRAKPFVEANFWASFAIE